MEISREKLVSSVKEGQSALVAYNQMHCEIRNLQQQMITIWKSLNQYLVKPRGERAEEVAETTFGTCQVLFEDVVDPNRFTRT